MNAAVLREAHELDDGEALVYYLDCALRCIRLGEQDVVVASMLEAVQRYLTDGSYLTFAEDRAALNAIIEYYDTIAA